MVVVARIPEKHSGSGGMLALESEIRSILQSGTLMMALTATAVKRTKEIIIKSLAMRNPVTITVSPNKVNLKYCVWMMDKNIPVEGKRHFYPLCNNILSNY